MEIASYASISLVMVDSSSSGTAVTATGGAFKNILELRTLILMRFPASACAAPGMGVEAGFGAGFEAGFEAD